MSILRFHLWLPACVLGVGVGGCSTPNRSKAAASATGDATTGTTEPGAQLDSGGGDTADTGSTPVRPAAAVRINELMAANRGSVEGPEGALLDWVELVNLAADSVDLSGWGLTDDWRDPHKARLPDGLVLAPAERALLWLDSEGRVEGALTLGLAREGEVLRLFDSRGEEADVLGYSDLGLDEAFARLPDGTGEGESMYIGTPGTPNSRLVERSFRYIQEGDDWKYLDGGQVPVGGMTGPWTGLEFDDSTWALGAAPLGYGDTQSTVIDDGSTDAGRALTAFFRFSFEVTEETISTREATVGLRADDGARVWLDGQELLRLGLPDGEVGPTTAASRTVAGDGELAYEELAIDQSLLAPGRHVVAVDLHQVSGRSSDMTFDLWLEVRRLVAEE